MISSIRRLIAAREKGKTLAQLRAAFPRESISTSRKRTITRQLPDPLVLSLATEGECWIQLAALEQLALTTAIAVALKFNRANSSRGATIEYAVPADDAEFYSLKAGGLLPRAGSVKELVVLLNGRNALTAGNPPELLSETLSFNRDSFAFSPVHDGLWARIEPTPRALSLTRLRLVKEVRSQIGEHAELGSLLIGVSLA